MRIQRPKGVRSRITRSCPEAEDFQFIDRHLMAWVLHSLEEYTSFVDMV